MTLIGVDLPVFCVIVVSPAHGWKNARQGLMVLNGHQPAGSESGGTDEEALISYVESRSMVANTIDRALRFVRGSRLIITLPRERRRIVNEGLIPPTHGLLIEQPHDAGNAAAILLSIVHVIEQDPEATVVVMPADQFVHPEERFLQTVAHASHLARSSGDKLVVLGAVPHHSEADARQVLAAPASNGAAPDSGAFAVQPHNGHVSSAAFLKGRLWNTGIMVARASTFWEIGRRLVPDMIRRFNMLRQVTKLVLDGSAPNEHAALALAHVYHGLGRTGSTFDAVQHAKESVLALPMEGVLWSDWAHPERVGRTLEAFLRDEIAARPHMHVRFVNDLSAGS